MIAQLERLVEIVGDEYDGLFEVALERDEMILHLLAYQRVQGAEGFVHKQDVGVRAQGARQAHPLLHAARELGRVGVLITDEPHVLYPAHRAPSSLSVLGSLDFQAVAHVLYHRHVREERESLKDHARDAPAEREQLLGRELENVPFINENLARGRVDQPVDMADQGRFSRSRKAHDHENLPALDGEAHVFQPQRAAGFDQHVVLLDSRTGQVERGFPRATCSEYLVDVSYLDQRHRLTPSRPCG